MLFVQRISYQALRNWFETRFKLRHIIAIFSILALAGCKNANPALTSLKEIPLKMNSGPTAVLSGTPSLLSNAPSLSVTVSGTNISQYKYKVGASGTTDCTSSLGYSGYISTAVPITDGLVDGLTTLCVLGADITGTEVQSLSSPTSYTWTRDTDPPGVTDVNTTETAGAYKTGDNFNISVQFDELVFVTGNPRILMAGASHYAVYSSGSGTGVLYFTFTVANGEDTPAFDYSGAATLEMNGGSITDSAGNTTGFSLPTPGSANSISGHKSIVIDTTAPTLSGSIFSSAPYSASLTTTPNLSWMSATDSGSGVAGYYVAIGTTSGSNDVMDWTFSASTVSSFSGLSLADGQGYFVSVKAKDNAGNYSSVNASGTVKWTVDATLPTTPTIVSDGKYSLSSTQSPFLVWMPSTDAASGIAKYEVSLGTSAGGTDVLPWTDNGNNAFATLSGLSLVPGTRYYPNVRAVDGAGNTSSVATLDGWAVVFPPPITDDFVYTLATANDHLFVGGEFARIGPATGSGSLINLSDGKISSSFKYWNRPNGNVLATAPDGSGGYFIGGSFTKVGSYSRSRLAHIFADGSVDPSWDVTVSGTVNTIQVASGLVFFGGNFTTVNGFSRTRLAAVTVGSGTLDSWNPSLNNTVQSIAISGSTVYAAGNFTGTRSYVAAFNIGNATPTAWNPNPNGAVNSVLAFGSEVYIGGSFTTAGGQPRNRVAAIDAMTGSASSFNASITNSSVNSLATDGINLYVGGSFTAPQNRLAAFSLSTSALVGWNPSPNNVVRTIRISAGEILVGGSFTTISGQSRDRIAKFDLGGLTLQGWSPVIFGNPAGSVYAIEPDASNVYVGCTACYSIGGEKRTQLAGYNLMTGQVDNWNPNPNGTWISKLFTHNAYLYVGGDYSTIASSTRYSLSRFDVSSLSLDTWAPNAKIGSLAGDVYTMAVDSNKLYVGGDFDNFNGTGRNYLASFDLSGSPPTLTAWDPNANGSVRSLLPLGGKIYTGGAFSNLSGQTRFNLARFDGSTGSLDAWVVNTDNSVESMDRDLAGNLWIAGSFTSVGGTSALSLAKVNPTSLVVSPVTDEPGPLYCVMVQDTNVYVGGIFGFAGGTPRGNTAGYQTSGALMSSWNPDLDVEATVFLDMGEFVLIGGAHELLDNTGSANPLFPYLSPVDPIFGLPVSP